MGITYTTIWFDCGVGAPDIGDGGRIGSPGLATRRSSGKVQSFGYIYRGFEAVHLLSHELEAFRAYLVEHQGHRVRIFDEYELAESEIPDYPRKTRWFRFKDRDFVKANYEMHCEKCNLTVRLDHKDELRPFEAVNLRKDDARLFRQRVLDLDTEENFHRAGFLTDPYELAPLGEFLQEHARHAVVARLAKDRPRSRVPKALR